MKQAIYGRAKAIAEGLMRTGRASEPQSSAGYFKLRANHGSGFYWISADGSRLLRGDDLDDAEELQPKFVLAMIRAGYAM